jgi:UDP-N-acetylglucosamine 4,6-dehydratase
MIGEEDAPYTYEYPSYYKVLPQINGWSDDPARIKNGVKVGEGFRYSSESNDHWMQPAELLAWLSQNTSDLGRVL